jgi:hypothetical protein
LSRSARSIPGRRGIEPCERAAVGFDSPRSGARTHDENRNVNVGKGAPQIARRDDVDEQREGAVLKLHDDAAHCAAGEGAEREAESEVGLGDGDGDGVGLAALNASACGTSSMWRMIG